MIVTYYSAPHPGRKTVSGCSGAAGCLCDRLSQGTAFSTLWSRVIGGNIHFRLYSLLNKGHKYPKTFAIAMQYCQGRIPVLSKVIMQEFHKVSLTVGNVVMVHVISHAN